MIVLDVEATGVEPKIHSIVSLGALDLANPTNRFYMECKVWDGAHIMDEALGVNGFTREQVTDASKPSEADLTHAFLQWSEGVEERTFAGQNVSFDRDFLKEAAERAGHTNWPFAHRTLDTHTMCFMHMIHRGLQPHVCCTGASCCLNSCNSRFPGRKFKFSYRMHLIRRFGMYLSLTIISVVHAVRYWTSFRTSSIQGVRVILVKDRSVVLVTHWYAPWTWTLPGGGVNKNEAAEAAAIREVKEETGFDVKSLAGEIGKYKGTWGRGDMVMVFYTGDFEGSLTLTPNIEIMGRSWFDIDNLPEELSPANRRRIEAYRDGVRGEVGKW